MRSIFLCVDVMLVPSGADNVLSGACIEAIAVEPDKAVGGREPVDSSTSCRAIVGISDRSDKRPAPAAAIIWGLSGLDEELRLPFRECWIPCTMEVWR